MNKSGFYKDGRLYENEWDAPEDEVRVDALVKCADCGTETDKPYDNGDGKDRCETCAVRKYGHGTANKLWPKNKPFSNCDT